MAGEADETTLRLIAGLPAPEGLEDRVKAGCAAHSSADGPLLHWPLARGDRRAAGCTGGCGTFARSALAAIVFVVAGGGWEVYSRVQPAQEPKVIAIPPVAGHGGFSSANAMRTPQTLNGTVLTIRWPSRQSPMLTQ